MSLRFLEADQIMMLEGAAPTTSRRFARFQTAPRVRGARFGPPPARMVPPRGRERLKTRPARLSGASFGSVLGDVGVGMNPSVAGTASDPLKQAILLRRAQRAQREGIDITSALGFGIPFIDLSDIGDGAKKIVKTVESGVKKIGKGAAWTGKQIASVTDSLIDKLEQIGCGLSESEAVRLVADAAEGNESCVGFNGKDYCASLRKGSRDEVQQAVKLVDEACRVVKEARAAVDGAKNMLGLNTTQFTYMNMYRPTGEQAKKLAADVAARRQAQAAAAQAEKNKKLLLYGGGAAAVALALFL